MQFRLLAKGVIVLATQEKFLLNPTETKKFYSNK